MSDGDFHTDHPRMRGEDFDVREVAVDALGSPPHARGKPVAEVELGRNRRITPACAGKTVLPTWRGIDMSDHPRMRGEDQRSRAHHFTASGSPPHARGRRGCCAQRSRSGRITPACAGKTSRRPGGRRSATDHPRMRGEDAIQFQNHRGPYGSPPHARGRQPSFPEERTMGRITPACAGKTAPEQNLGQLSRDHPRMRGEDSTTGRATPCRTGSPPHARGRPIFLCWC